MDNRSSQDQERILNRARQIMEEQSVDQATALAIAEAEGVPQPEVRAPIAPTTTRLIGNDTPMRGHREYTGHDLMMETVGREMESMRREMRRNAEQGGLSIAFNHNNSNNASNSDNNSPETSGNNRATNLQDLFSPPVDILYQGSWEQTREEAKEKNKWILANIQKDSEFLSYNLNRDLWCNEIVKELLKSNFIFFQHDETTTEAQKYKALYNPGNLPHIAIVDPFTGEQMIEIELAPYQHDSADMLAAFLEVTNGFLDSNVLEGAKRKKMQEKLLERQLEKHVNAGSSAPVSKVPPPTPVDLASGPETAAQVDADVQLLDDIETLEPEPAAGPDTLIVQVKLFGKKAVKRRFKKEDRVSSLFAFVRSQHVESRNKSFDLITYPRRSLKDFQESTLLEQRLANATVIAKFVE